MKPLKLMSLVLVCLYACKETPKSNDKTQENNKETIKASSEVFELLDSNVTGIDFSNTLKENVATKENLFDYDFFYNGSGVGIEDLNNDGLKDIFFCGNQEANKIYLNKGNMKFEDVSEKANINSDKKWSTGVTFVDINNDGWMDIYVSQGGPFDATQRGNLLFINQKDMTFVESAEAYGLKDTGISSQAAFFDYDNDGDLDCVVMNENELYGVDPTTFYNALKNKELLQKNTSNLYRNDSGKFTKVTEAAGLLRPSFGLGLAVSDINNDGWLDIYIANDYYVPDAYYLNNKNGTFKNVIKEDLNHISFYGMGVDIADINNDAAADIFVLDMASSDHIRSKTLMASMNEDRFNMLIKDLDMPHQYMFNSLQLNLGNNKFQNVSHLTKMAKTDWSWAALMVDFDNDALKDVYVTNGYRKYALDNDFRRQVIATQQQYRGNVPLEVKQDLYDKMIPGKLPNILYKNKGDLVFKDVAKDWGLATPSFSNGASYADLDNDGDLDIVVNNIDAKAFVYKNTINDKKTSNYISVALKGKLSEPFAKVFAIHNGITQEIEAKRVRGYLSATDNQAHFGLGNSKTIDTLRVVWLNGKYEERYNIPANQKVIFKEDEANGQYVFKPINEGIKVFENSGISFLHKENEFNDFKKEVLLPYRQSTLGPCITVGDLNQDGNEDIFVGGAFGQSGAVYYQTANGFSKATIPTIEKDKQYEDMQATIFDFNGDKLNDIFIVSGGYALPYGNKEYVDRLYINKGNGEFERMNKNTLDNFPNSGKSVVSFDMDNDGDMDILVGNRTIPQQYPKHVPSVLFENVNGTLKEVSNSKAKALQDFGIINDLIATDFDKDGQTDIIAVGEWTSIGMFKNENGVFKDVSAEYGLDTVKGWWFNITETDVNNDGFKDYIIGNVGENIKFKASKEKPFKVFANDFDNNGTLDIVLSNDYNGEYVPVRGKECSTQQMPFISEKFKKYEDFANATLNDIYGNKLYAGYNRETTTFSSVILINDGNGGFKVKNLPKQAQAFPMLGVTLTDFNNDGYEDIITAGNIYDTEVETPRLDGGNGLVLLSNKKDGYIPLKASETGFYVDGNVKDLAIIKHKGLNAKIILAVKNNDASECFIINNK